MKLLLVKMLLGMTISTAFTAASKYSYDTNIYMMTSEHGSRVWMHTNGTETIADDFIFDFDDSFELEAIERKGNAYDLYGLGLHYMMNTNKTMNTFADDFIADWETGLEIG